MGYKESHLIIDCVHYLLILS